MIFLQAANIAARRHELSGESPAKPKSLQISDQVNDPEWQEDIGRRMLEDLGRGLVPNLEGLGALVEQARGLKGEPASDAAANAKTTAASAASSRSNAARKSDDVSEAEGDVWDKLMNGELSQKDIEWVRIKSFMDEKKKK